MKRSILFNIHFYLSSFFTPFLLVMAFTGTCYLFGIKGSSEKTLLSESVPLEQEDKQQQISNLLKSIDQSYSFEYLKDRGSSIQTRPTTRVYYDFKQQNDGSFSLTKVEPNILSRLIEVHKGHGPSLLKNFQKILGMALVLIVISGLLMSLKIQKRAKPFLVSTTLGLIVFLLMFFM